MSTENDRVVMLREIAGKMDEIEALMGRNQDRLDGLLDGGAPPDKDEMIAICSEYERLEKDWHALAKRRLKLRRSFRIKPDSDMLYKKMYHTLFHAMEKIADISLEAQRQAEEIYISSGTLIEFKPPEES